MSRHWDGIAVRSFGFALAYLSATTGFAAAPIAASGVLGQVRYSRDIRPLLSQNCFICHGQDDKRREAGLRLDIRESCGQRA